MIKNIIILLRPRQWLKNLMLYFPPFLGGSLFTEGFVSKAVLPFVSFCLISSASYIINDVSDKENDRHHPKKSTRPLAVGSISIMSAMITIAVLLGFSITLAYSISLPFLLLMLMYFCVSVSYSLKFKDIVLLDIFCIAAGFLLRLQAGGVAFAVHISEWLFLSVFLLSLFLSSGKRVSEKLQLGNNACHHRKVLDDYPCGFLEGILYVTGSAVLVTYSMYVINRHSALLLYSVPLCCLGLFRYIWRVQTGKGGDPTDSLTRDAMLLIIGAVWVGLVGWGIYGRP